MAVAHRWVVGQPIHAAEFKLPWAYCRVRLPCLCAGTDPATGMKGDILKTSRQLLAAVIGITLLAGGMALAQATDPLVGS